MSLPSRRPLAGLAALALLLTACGDDDPAGDTERPTIIATTSIWADLVADLACGGQARVDTLVPVGGDPHSFEPSLADRGDLERAALVVANGLGLEEGLDDTLDAVEDGGTPVIRVAELVDPLPYSGDHDAHDEEHDEEHDDHDEEHDDDHHEELDPHVWFDPRRVVSVLEEVADRLVAVGLDPERVTTCRTGLEARLRRLDAEITAEVERIPVAARLLVTNHDSLGYYAARYDFEVIGTVLPAPSGLAETNPAQLEALAALIEARGVPAVFAEDQHDADDARALADRVGDVDVVTLLTGSLGAPGSDADSYEGLLRTNTAMIVDALG